MRIEHAGHSVFVGCGGLVPDDPARPWTGGATPRLVLLHGAGMDRTVWVLLARYFARHGIDVIVPDLPAHGSSAGPALASIEAMADWTAALLQTLQRQHGLGDGPLVVAGHSMGSFVALETAARCAGRSDGVAAVWLLGSGYPMSVGEPLLEAARRNSPVAAEMIATFGHAYASRLGHNDVAGISVFNSALALLLGAADGVLHTDLSACHAYGGAESASGRLSADTRVHVIGGDEDRMTPPRAARALADLTQAHLHTIADCGHMLMSEQPEAVLQTMRSLLEA